MTDELNRLGIFPGAPGTSITKKSNLMLALEEPHDLLHHQFFKDTIGVKGEKFFTPERMELWERRAVWHEMLAKAFILGFGVGGARFFGFDWAAGRRPNQTRRPEYAPELDLHKRVIHQLILVQIKVVLEEKEKWLHYQ